MICETAVSIQEHARIPRQPINSCIKKLSKLYDKYLILKRKTEIDKEVEIMKQNTFKKDVNKLFDATKNAIQEMRNEQGRKFLQKRREHVFSCSMAGDDLKTTAQDTKKRRREEKRLNKES